MSKLQLVGVVAIGRNEGSRLYQCLLSLKQENAIVVYVDSGSTDGSVSLAKSLGVHVVELDLSIPFTAARARNAGFEHLLTIEPNLELVQFIDGDCQIVKRWFEQAINHFDLKPEVVVVCGRRREEFPNESIFNRLCDMEWNTPIGETKACGGDSMMRVSAFKQAGGFNSTLIAGEEPELCLRLRQTGGKILRIDAEMTLHDARINNFGQWWKRTLRAGHAYAQGAWLHGRNSEHYWVKESQSIWLWGFGLPLIAIATCWLTFGLSMILLLIAYVYLGYKIYKYAISRNLRPKDAVLYSINCILGKFPQLQGQIQFHLSRLLKRQPTLVEYKSVIS